jgi:ribonuclease P protein component
MKRFVSRDEHHDSTLGLRLLRTAESSFGMQAAKKAKNAVSRDSIRRFV